MYHLKLIKGLSYSGIIEATKQHPDVFVENKATADAAVATGYFQLINTEREPEDEKGNGEMQPNGGRDNGQEPDGKEEQRKKKLEEMTVPELETFAAYKGISLKGVSKKADIIAKLKAELNTVETENEVDYGSPTMTELQQ